MLYKTHASWFSVHAHMHIWQEVKWIEIQICVISFPFPFSHANFMASMTAVGGSGLPV